MWSTQRYYQIKESADPLYASSANPDIPFWPDVGQSLGQPAHVKTSDVPLDPSDMTLTPSDTPLNHPDTPLDPPGTSLDPSDAPSRVGYILNLHICYRPKPFCIMTHPCLLQP